MLVLSRKVGESVQIGENVTVWVQKVEGKKVTLGFDAPQSVRILRDDAKKTNEAQVETAGRGAARAIVTAK